MFSCVAVAVLQAIVVLCYDAASPVCSVKMSKGSAPINRSGRVSGNKHGFVFT